MKCRNISIVLLLVFLLLPLHGLSSDEITPEKLKQLSTELTEISKSFNEILVTSNLSLMDILEDFPVLLKRLTDFETKLETFETKLENTYQNSGALSQDLIASMVELQQLKSQFEKVLSSVETFQISLMNIEESVKNMKKRTNAGLVIAIIAALVAGYTYLKDKF